ncbi:hypothetical protein P692DRAFT_20178115 [Suillus brevipes Sb2]|nr:hypothetical protein P692DRAFT_20178115 [Suillus brevipes Sb2]
MTKNLSMIEREKFFDFLCLGVTLLPTHMDGPDMLFIHSAFTLLHCSLNFSFTQLFSTFNEDSTETTFPRPILETLLNLQCGHLGIDRYLRYALISLLGPRLFHRV